jgi:hypothetical protein
VVGKTRPLVVMSCFKTEGQNEYWRILSAVPNRGNLSNLYKWLTSTQGRELRQHGGVAEETTVQSQDQWRMLQVNTHSFPSNYWRHKITKSKESNKCDLCKVLWIVEGSFNTDDDLPIQTLGHIQQQCEALSEIHTLVHHRCWCIIHAELGRLTSSKWRFVYINGEKNLKTIWNDLEDEFPEVFVFCSVETLENATMEQERHRPLTEAEERQHKADTPKE